MRPRLLWMVIAPTLMLLFGCAGGAPTRVANTPQRPGAQHSGRPGPPRLRCARTRPTFKPGSGGAGDSLVPASPTDAVLCVYAGLNDNAVSGGFLIARVVVADPAALATAINDSTNYPWSSGAVNCPADDGQIDVAHFAYADWSSTRVEIDLTGCASAVSTRDTVTYLLSPDASSLVRDLEGALRHNKF